MIHLEKNCGVKSGRGKILVENMTATDGTGDAEKWLSRANLYILLSVADKIFFA